MRKEVTVEVSARHLHISESDFKVLFDKAALTKLNDISQPGQFAAEETVMLKGFKGEIDNVRILGPFRAQTQIELAKTDTYTLGIEAPLRLSGELEDSAGITIIGPAGQIDLKQGVIIAIRHIHISPAKAQEWNLSHGQKVSVRVGDGSEGDIKDMIFEEVIVRVGKEYELTCHIDTDEANAANINKSTEGIILE